jgi:hypothetical protein
MHPTKTKVVYCKDRNRKGKYPNLLFGFLEYCFRPRRFKNSWDKSLFCGFNPAVSPSAVKAMRKAIRGLNLRRQTQLSLEDIARQLNPLLRGWTGYYGRYAPSRLAPLLDYVNQTLAAWARRKFKRFNRSKTLASKFLHSLAKTRGHLRSLAHRVDWIVCLMGAESHVRFCERLVVKSRRPTLPLRAGLATSAAERGQHERDIMQQTRHKSLKMLRRYIRKGSPFSGKCR